MTRQFGFMYLMFTTFPELYSEIYHFSLGIAGLAYLGFGNHLELLSKIIFNHLSLGMGLIVGILLGRFVANKIYSTLTEKNGGVSKPEYRVPSMVLGGILTPVGLL